ncbi:uncharacterized protein LOC122374380 [Amphibalanus amphitrite]|uniref:uncharacterized protein LOC122374380 n=1 Tax=Amphibalanus amphitrite TaxID=1232801 RepID=UPI001C91BC22|nr:uncharacterized protein LOC122374380 [Amphibalanus amphitrite]
MATRTPVPTPRRSHRTRRPPKRYEDGIVDLPTMENIHQRITDDEDRASETTSAITSVSATSRCSVLSARAAALRVERLRQEHELQRRSEEAARALELHRACSELELATLAEKELGQARQERATRTDLESPQPAHLPAALVPPRPEREQNDAELEQCQTEQLACTNQQSPTAAPVVTAPTHVTISQPPKMDILAFDGRAERYPFFKMQVNEARDSGNFTDLQITQHLRERLRGEAFEAVHGTLLSGGSLSRILHVLESRFGNPFLITHAVTEKVMNRPKVRSNDVRDLSQFCADIYNTLSILEAVGYESELDNYSTLSTLVEKLPQESQLGWGAFARAQIEAGHPLTCRLLYEYINSHLKDRQFGAPKTQRPEKASRQRSYATSKVDDPQKKREQRARKTTDCNLSCFYCSKPHWIARCDSFRGLSVEERWRWTKANECCLRCLSTEHKTTACHRMQSCGIEGCQDEHHRLLHRPAAGKAQMVGVLSDGRKYATMMKTVTIDVTGPSKTRRCVAYLDEGSSVTLMSQALADEIGCQGRQQCLRMKTMSGISDQEAMLVDVKVGNVKTGKIHQLNDVFVISTLELDKNPVPMKTMERKFHLVKQLNLPDIDEEPQILIGLDNAELISTRELLRTTKNGPILQRTELGWTVTGRVVTATDVSRQSVQFIREGVSRELDDLVKSTWTTESFGCKFQRNDAYSPEDQAAEQILDKEVHHDGIRWTAPLLRKNGAETLPESRKMAEKRAISFERKLDRSAKNEVEGQPTFAKMCYERIDKMESDGHIRKLSTEEAAQEPPNTWYLPLLAVTNANKPNKVRLVLDAAARSHGKCLNDFLMRGPDYFNSIPGILLRWREKPIGITSDVVAMFSQIQVEPSDRASLRFLWRGRRREGPFDTYESNTVIFGSKSSPSTAGYCFRKTGQLFGKDNHDVVAAILHDTYVDDVITGAETSEKASALIRDLTSTLRCGGFELGPWASNSSEVLEALQPVLRASGDVSLGDKSMAQRALGIIWTPETDEIIYKAKPAPETVTKRTVLSHVMSVFDPLGFLSGWLLTVRVLLQQLWKQELGWDTPIPDQWEKPY